MIHIFSIKIFASCTFGGNTQWRWLMSKRLMWTIAIIVWRRRRAGNLILRLRNGNRVGVCRCCCERRRRSWRWHEEQNDNHLIILSYILRKEINLFVVEIILIDLNFLFDFYIPITFLLIFALALMFFLLSHSLYIHIIFLHITKCVNILIFLIIHARFYGNATARESFLDTANIFFSICITAFGASRSV